MWIAVISAPAVRRAVPPYVAALARGMESRGHRVDILDAWTEDGHRLPAYEYIAVTAEPVSLFGGKLPEVISRVLLGAGSGLGGKRSAAFLKKTGPFTSRALGNLMGAMEHEGMRVNWSALILSEAQAEYLGKQIGG
ncbi:MAG: hypothetical protein LBU28_04900 [Spirochaetaceae bacterium]|jgi:hypothetical protein|nr:hypothetical protein [Spirochaetaceae bacterium]